MELHRLFLRDFRNYSELDLTFDASVHVIYGANASGKTNILEAIYYLATASSHRTHRAHELIRWGAPGFFIKAQVRRHSRLTTLEFLYDEQGRRGFKVNGVSKQSTGELYGRFSAVFFSPEDLQLVKGAPSVRRRFLDFELSQASDNYSQFLAEYRRALTQRNNLLKEFRSRGRAPGLLDVWNEQLVRYGVEVMVRRMRALQDLSSLLRVEHNRLTSGEEELRLTYDCSVCDRPLALTVPPDKERLTRLFGERLEAQHDEEIARGYTLCGPHRDDLVFVLDSNDARSFASQGQQRTIVLALKLAAVSWLEDKLGESPVLLLDDVLSELDPTRRQRLLERAVGGVQTFITCTDLSDVQGEVPGDVNIYRVADGRAQQEEDVF